MSKNFVTIAFAAFLLLSKEYASSDRFTSLFQEGTRFYKIDEHLYILKENPDYVYDFYNNNLTIYDRNNAIKSITFYPNGQMAFSSIFGFLGINPILDDSSRWHDRKIDYLGRVVQDSCKKEKNGKMYSLVSKMDSKTGKIVERQVIDLEDKSMVERYNEKHEPMELTIPDKGGEFTTSEVFTDAKTWAGLGNRLLNISICGKEVIWVKKQEWANRCIYTEISLFDERTKITNTYTFFDAKTKTYCFKRKEV